MPADSPALPDKYTAFDVKGVTRGSTRPTVYMKDGSRFTQIHLEENNIGYHRPCIHLFFGNVPASEVATTAQRGALVAAARNNALAFRGARAGEELRLFEIKADRAPTGGLLNVRPHVSREAFEEDVSIAEKFKLLSEIRSRSANKQQDPHTHEWFFV